MNNDSKLTLANLCGPDAVQEVFDREMQAIWKNIQDVSTPGDAKRQITLVFDVAPFPDRRGATISFTCKSKLASVEAVSGTVFLQKKSGGGDIEAFIHDPMQERLFAEEPTASPNKQ